MRILAVADHESPALGNHFNRDRWGAIDAIVSCGDLPAAYLEQLLDHFRVPVYYVRGNHDHGYAEHPPGGGDDLDGRIVTVGGLRVLGLEGSRWYGGKGVEYSETQMAVKVAKARLRLLIGGVDIVVAHAPPRFCPTLDCPSSQGHGRPCILRPGDVCTEAADRPHAGFEAFRQLILAKQPAYFLHGHTHLGYNANKRERRLGSTRVIDCYGYYILEL